MKPAALVSMLFLLLASTAKAQLSLLPQIGFDRSKTSIQYNDLSSFSPLDGNLSLKANVRLDYRFKKGHGPFIGLGTSPAVVEFTFTDPSKAISNFKASTASLVWTLEAGYQYRSKAIPLTKTTKTDLKEKKQCGSSYFGCGAKQKVNNNKAHNNNMNLRLQPSLGFAYTPSIKNDILNKSNGYSYITGNWKSAIVSGMGFEFGKGKDRIITLTMYYTKGLGSNQTKTISEIQAGKPVIHSFSSSTSRWGMTVGVPVSLNKTKKTSAKKHSNQSNQKRGCQGRTETYKKCVKRI